MDDRRFDAIAQELTGTTPRRTVVRLFAALILGVIPARSARAGAPDGGASTCRPAQERCQRGNQCCSGVCKKTRGKGRKRRKKKGTCTSLGPFAANCPPVTTCSFDPESPECQVGDVEGRCTVTASGEPFCARVSTCFGNEPICQTDEDCFEDHGPDAKCLPCPDNPVANCHGDVMCAVYAGD